MSNSNYNLVDVPQGVPIKMWTQGVPVEPEAEQQLRNTAKLPFIYNWLAVMPDVHVGKGSTIGSVIPTLGAIIPAAVGVDIGCGMMAVQTSLKASDLPENLRGIRSAIEKSVPHGRNSGGRDKGAWSHAPDPVLDAWKQLAPTFKVITAKYPKLAHTNNVEHLGTLGTGNHFIEICLDESQAVWFMLHSGSRGVGNAIGRYFIELARQDMRKWQENLPDQDLAYLSEGTKHFDDYVEAVTWAQQYAALNRQVMMQNVIAAVKAKLPKPFHIISEAVNCHHNYVQCELHYGVEVYVTRKGAVSAKKDQLGIIPGSMGACSFIVRGRGNAESFHSCSHGAGRLMSRTEARRRFTLNDHICDTKGVECRKDEKVIDETPRAYKPIEAVMHAQRDLVEIVHTLRQVVCVKG